VKATILYIEDNEQNMYLVTFLLKAKGYGGPSGREGPEGIAMAARPQAGLVLLDIQLPGMDGYTVARHIRGNPEVAKTLDRGPDSPSPWPATGRRRSSRVLGLHRKAD